MSTKDCVETPLLGTSSERLTGRVKWFNNKAGYGFITLTDGPKAGSDIFVHHSSIMVSNEQYKYLVQGEYIEFKLDTTANGKHDVQAADVSGIKGGKLMCETRSDFRQMKGPQMNQEQDSTQVDENAVKMPRSVRAPRSSVPRSSAPRLNGQGPREGQQWTLAKGANQPASNRGTRPVGAGNNKERSPRAN